MKISSKVMLLAAVMAFITLNASAYLPRPNTPITRAPDAGTTMPLLGMALIAVDAIRRKLKA
jgi:hypothetical protein